MESKGIAVSQSENIHGLIQTAAGETGAGVIFATRSGCSTLDRDAKGGNPFATALIELSGTDYADLGAFAEALQVLTERYSAGKQSPEWAGLPLTKRWNLHCGPSDAAQRRAALVLIVSDYSQAGRPPLLGAARDELRISECLTKNGFAVTDGVRPDHASLLNALRAFEERSRGCDSALIYATGHGVEFAGETYLLPGSYPFEGGYSEPVLRDHAVSLTRIRQACDAAATNVVFFAGCRTRA